jgi:SAM-dependent methyltransferase
VSNTENDPCDICGAKETMRPSLTISLSGVYDAEIRGCAGCRFRQVRPRLSDFELRQLYPSIYFDPDSTIGFEDYARQQQRSEREAYVLARRLGGSLDGGSALEVGCALGFFLDALRRYTALRVRGIDVAPFAAYFARRRYGLEVAALTLEEAGFPDASFDLVIQKDILEHVLRPREHLQETFRILRPGGLVWLVTPIGEANLRPLVRRAGEEHDARTGMLPMIEQGHLSFFTRENLLRLFRECGFEVVRMRNIHVRRGLRALGYLPRKRWKERLAPAGRPRPAVMPAAASEAASTAAREQELASLYTRLSAEVDRRRSSFRGRPLYFAFRQAVRSLDALPAPLTFGLDFDCLLRRPA